MECVTPPPTFQSKDMRVFTALADEVPEGLMRLGALVAKLPPDFYNSLLTYTVHAAPMQFHAIFLAMFASVIAPFGGFFASGFKRGFDIKDFGDSIPGHGGMTDRMDCQVVMAAFSYIYYHTYVERNVLSMGAVLATAMKLAPPEQLQLLEHLANSLVGQQVLPEGLGLAIGEFVNNVVGDGGALENGGGAAVAAEL